MVHNKRTCAVIFDTVNLLSEKSSEMPVKSQNPVIHLTDTTKNLRTDFSAQQLKANQYNNDYY